MADLYFSNQPGVRSWQLTIRDLQDRALFVQGTHVGRETAIATAQAFNRLDDDYGTMAKRYDEAVRIAAEEMARG